MIAVMRTILIVGLSMLLLAACERGTQDLRRWVAEVKQRTPEPIEPIPPIRTAEVVAYDAMDLRDPFRAAPPRSADEVAEGEGEGLRPDPDRQREYLEEFPLDTLDMVGTLVIEETEYALVRDNENVVHRVREGNYMGQNHGLVTAVHADRVEVRELVQDGRGGWMERRTRLAMAEE